MGNDDCTIAQDRVATDVVTIAVGVDDDPNRIASELGQLIVDCRRGPGVAGVY